jgi:hypothetical protein
VVVSVSVAGPVNANGAATIACRATDDSSVFGMRAAVSGGTLPDGEQFQLTPGPDVSATLRWSTPAAPGTYLVTCTAQDGYYSASAQANVTVEAPAAPPPAVSDLAGPKAVRGGTQATFSVTAVDDDGVPLQYAWSAAAGTIAGAGPEAVWTAPQASGSFAISVAVSNPGGGRATASTTVAVQLADHDGTLAS